MKGDLFYIKLLLTFVLGISSFSIHSQRLIFDNIGVNGGLPATEAYHLYQDKKGYVWAFTEYGMVKHNGRSFVSVCKNLGLEQSAVYAVAENTNGEMFIANSKAEVYQVINDKAYKVYGLESMTKKLLKTDDYILRIFFNDRGTLHISTYVNSFIFSPDKYWLKGQKNKIKRFKKRKKVEILPYVIPKNDKTPRVEREYLLRFSSSNGRPYTIRFDNTRLGHRMYLKRNGNGDYFGLNSNVTRYNGKKRLQTFHALYEILDLEISNNGHVWVATNNNGLWELDKDLKPLNHYFKKTIISDILFDNQDGMWITSVGEGVFHCKNIHRKSFWNNEELNSGISRIEKINNRLFVGTLAGNLFVLNRENFERIDLGKTFSPVYDIDFSGNHYFVAAARSFYELNSGFGVERRIDDACYAFTICTFNNNHLILGEHTKILEYTPGNGMKKILFNPGKPRNFEHRNAHEILFNNRSRVGIIVDDKLIFPEYLRELTDKRISCIKTDQKGNVWLCTKGYGLYRLTPDNHLLHLSGIPSLIINDVRFISGNRIILSTNKGAFMSIVHLNQDEFSWERILYEEVLCVEEIAGKIYFGTKRGLITCGTHELYQRNNVRFYLNSVFVNSKRSHLKKAAFLRHDQNDLVFNYDFLNYHLTEPKIEYQLAGPTTLKGFASDNKVHFQNLIPGEYVLRVSPKVDFETNRNLEIVTKFVIEPAFWQTGLFQVTIIVLIVMVTILLVVYFVSRKNRRQRAKDEIEKLVTEHRLTALKAQVNSHFMSNSMVAIQRLIMEGDTDSANLYLAKFSLLLRSLLDYSGKSAASLRKELEMISLYVELEQLRFSHHFTFQIEIDGEVDADKTYIPALFTQPFVENAIWHGLLPLKMLRQPKLVIRIFYEGDFLVISIGDNGVGRNANVNPNPLRISHGSQLMLDRIEGMNKLYHSNSGKVKFVDLLDENQLPIGTEVLIYFPEKILRELSREV